MKHCKTPQVSWGEEGRCKKSKGDEIEWILKDIVYIPLFGEICRKKYID